MSNLPTEVLNNIFNYLHYEQKLECMLVCHKWTQVIRTISLFHTLVLQPNDGFHDCNSLINRLESHPQSSSQVRRLIVFGGFNQRSDPNKLFHLFPQLHVLYLRQLHVLQPDCTAVQSKYILGWQHSLERLVERQTNVFSTALLKMGIFYRLTELSLSNGNDEHSPDIFTLLKNTPALNRLELENYAISWLQFESLHKNVAQLSVLLLNSVKTPQQPYRNAVEPNSILKTLTIRHCTLGYDEQFHWIRYIVQKYSDLEHFTFFVLPVPDQRRVEIDEYHERLIMPLVDGLGTQLKTFVLKHGLFTHKLFQALDSKEYRLNKLGLYSLVTPEADQGLFQSHQATYLRELSLFRADFKSFKQFKVFKHLKSLKLSFGEDRNQVIQDHSMVSIALNEMLSELPKQLEELVLVSCAVRIEPFVSSLPSQIRSLTFDNTELDSQVSTFISDYCRRLHTLSLILCQPGLSTILLPDHRLSCFEIFSHDTQPIFMLTIGDQHHYYNMNRVLFRGLKGIKRYFGVQDTPAFATRTADQDPINSTRPIIHLTCRSLSALYINTRLAI